ncbi:MAG TPA: MFS transporter [Acidimicrobiia bacterium]|nr:MFS transporter [Acidimicrobiia bacterium]
MRAKLARQLHVTFASLGNRNFRLFFVGQGVSQIGNWLTLVAQTLLVLKLTGNGVAIGVLAAFQFGPILLIGAWTGLVADRSDKRKLLFIVQVFAMAQTFVLAGLAFMDQPPLAAIYIVAAAGGVTLAFDNPARRAFVVEMVPTDQVNNAVSINSAIMTSSRIIGPALAGLLIATVGFGWAFVFDGVSYIAVLVALAMMRTSELRPSAVTERAKAQVRAGLRYVATVPDLWVPLAMMAVVGTFAFNFQVVLPLLVTRTFGGGDTAFTMLFSVISVGALVGALMTARRSFVGVREVAGSAVAFGVAMLAFAAAPNLAFAFPVGLFVGASSIAFLTASTAIVQLRASPEMRGRVLALQAIVFLGSTPVGGPILGYVSDTLGPRAGVAIGGVAACGAGVAGWWVYRRIQARAGEAVVLSEPVVPNTPHVPGVPAAPGASPRLIA